MPVDGFFEWKAIKGQKAKQPYAIAMRNGSPFGIGGLWENWRDPTSSEWVRTFAIITTDANELVAEIHDRMPLILAPAPARTPPVMIIEKPIECRPEKCGSCGMAARTDHS